MQSYAESIPEAAKEFKSNRTAGVNSRSADNLRCFRLSHPPLLPSPASRGRVHFGVPLWGKGTAWSPVSLAECLGRPLHWEGASWCPLRGGGKRLGIRLAGLLPRRTLPRFAG